MSRKRAFAAAVLHVARPCQRSSGISTIIVIISHQKHTGTPDAGTFETSDAGDGIRTHELLRDKDLNLTPLTRLGDSRKHTP